jgi:hypothetical protein
MRVSQIQNLTWAGNVLVLGGVVWVGLQFWNVKHAKAAPEPTWAKAKTDDVGKQRWPGERTVFDDIHKTPINGKVPPPPEIKKEVVKVDRTTEFKGKLKYVSGVQFPDTPEMSLARVTYDGKDMWVRPGDDVGGFRLIEFSLVAPKAAAAPDGKPARPERETIVRMVFRNPDPEAKESLLVIEQPDPQTKSLLGDGNQPFVPATETADIKPGLAPETGPIAAQAYQTPEGDWVITEAEQLWIEVWGDKHVLPNLGMSPNTDASGIAHGVKITSLPESKTPLAPSHGLAVQDVVKSINGVAVNSKEEILEYLRGPGKGLYKYVVVVDTNGADRTVTYRVPRPVKASRD